MKYLYQLIGSHINQLKSVWLNSVSAKYYKSHHKPGPSKPLAWFSLLSWSKSGYSHISTWLYLQHRGLLSYSRYIVEFSYQNHEENPALCWFLTYRTRQEGWPDNDHTFQENSLTNSTQGEAGRWGHHPRKVTCTPGTSWHRKWCLNL